MCWSSSKSTLIVVAILCICMNGFNLCSRLFGIRDDLRENKVAAYLPDVSDISKWVDGRKNSDAIAMGLAGVSLIFDVTLLAGACLENRLMIQGSGMWGSLDCIADAVIGFLSANYTIPDLKREERTVHHARRSKEIRGIRRIANTLFQEEKKGKGKTTHTKETRGIELREPEPSVAKQFLHFAWVILRLVIKAQLLCTIFSYASFLGKKSESSKGGGGGGGGGGTTMSAFD